MPAGLFDAPFRSYFATTSTLEAVLPYMGPLGTIWSGIEAIESGIDAIAGLTPEQDNALSVYAYYGEIAPVVDARATSLLNFAASPDGASAIAQLHVQYGASTQLDPEPFQNTIEAVQTHAPIPPFDNATTTLIAISGGAGAGVGLGPGVGAGIGVEIMLGFCFEPNAPSYGVGFGTAQAYLGLDLNLALVYGRFNQSLRGINDDGYSMVAVNLAPPGGSPLGLSFFGFLGPSKLRLGWAVGVGPHFGAGFGLNLPFGVFRIWTW
jgi:hypothetical protein